MTKKIYLDNLNLNHFTELDAELHCQIFNINPDNITVLYLNDNNLRNISGISIFKNLKILYLSNNDIKDFSFLTDLSSLKNLINLELLSISYLDLTDEIQMVNILKSLPNLKVLRCFNTFKTVDIYKELKRITIYD